MTINGMCVLGTPQQAEQNFEKWAGYQTRDIKAKLLLVSLIAHQYRRQPLAAQTIREQSLLSQHQLKKTLESLAKSGVVRVERGRFLRIVIP